MLVDVFQVRLIDYVTFGEKEALRCWADQIIKTLRIEDVYEMTSSFVAILQRHCQWD